MMKKGILSLAILMIFLLAFVVSAATIGPATIDASKSLGKFSKVINLIPGINTHNVGSFRIEMPQDKINELNEKILAGEFTNPDLIQDPKFREFLVNNDKIRIITKFGVPLNMQGLHGIMMGEAGIALLPPEERVFTFPFKLATKEEERMAPSPIPKELLPRAKEVYNFIIKNTKPGALVFGGGGRMASGSIMIVEAEPGENEQIGRIILYENENNFRNNKPLDTFIFYKPDREILRSQIANYLKPGTSTYDQVKKAIEIAQNRDFLIAKVPPKTEPIIVEKKSDTISGSKGDDTFQQPSSNIIIEGHTFNLNSIGSNGEYFNWVLDENGKPAKKVLSLDGQASLAEAKADLYKYKYSETRNQAVFQAGKDINNIEEPISPGSLYQPVPKINPDLQQKIQERLNSPKTQEQTQTTPATTNNLPNQAPQSASKLEFGENYAASKTSLDSNSFLPLLDYNKPYVDIIGTDSEVYLFNIQRLSDGSILLKSADSEEFDIQILPGKFINLKDIKLPGGNSPAYIEVPSKQILEFDGKSTSQISGSQGDDTIQTQIAQTTPPSSVTPSAITTSPTIQTSTSSTPKGVIITKTAEGTVITIPIYSKQFIDPLLKKSKELHEDPRVRLKMTGFRHDNPVLFIITIALKTDPYLSPQILVAAKEYYSKYGTLDGFESSGDFFSAVFLNLDFEVRIDLAKGVKFDQIYGTPIAEGIVFGGILKPWQDAGLITYTREVIFLPTGKEAMLNGYLYMTGGTNKEAQEAALKLIKAIYPNYNKKGDYRLGYPDINVRSLKLTGTAPTQSLPSQIWSLVSNTPSDEGSFISLTTTDKDGKSKQVFVLSTANPKQKELVASLSGSVNGLTSGEKPQQLAQTTPTIKPTIVKAQPVIQPEQPTIVKAEPVPIPVTSPPAASPPTQIAQTPTPTSPPPQPTPTTQIEVATPQKKPEPVVTPPPQPTPSTTPSPPQPTIVKAEPVIQPSPPTQQPTLSPAKKTIWNLIPFGEHMRDTLTEINQFERAKRGEAVITTEPSTQPTEPEIVITSYKTQTDRKGIIQLEPSPQPTEKPKSQNPLKKVTDLFDKLFRNEGKSLPTGTKVYKPLSNEAVIIDTVGQDSKSTSQQFYKKDGKWYEQKGEAISPSDEPVTDTTLIRNLDNAANSKQPEIIVTPQDKKKAEPTIVKAEPVIPSEPEVIPETYPPINPTYLPTPEIPPTTSTTITLPPGEINPVADAAEAERQRIASEQVARAEAERQRINVAKEAALAEAARLEAEKQQRLYDAKMKALKDAAAMKERKDLVKKVTKIINPVNVVKVIGDNLKKNFDVITNKLPELPPVPDYGPSLEEKYPEAYDAKKALLSHETPSAPVLTDELERKETPSIVKAEPVIPAEPEKPLVEPETYPPINLEPMPETSQTEDKFYKDFADFIREILGIEPPLGEREAIEPAVGDIYADSNDVQYVFKGDEWVYDVGSGTLPAAPETGEDEYTQERAFAEEEAMRRAQLREQEEREAQEEPAGLPYTKAETPEVQILPATLEIPSEPIVSQEPTDYSRIDSDGDGIPDSTDPAPDNPNVPGSSQANEVQQQTQEQQQEEESLWYQFTRYFENLNENWPWWGGEPEVQVTDVSYAYPEYTQQAEPPVNEWGCRIVTNFDENGQPVQVEIC